MNITGEAEERQELRRVSRRYLVFYLRVYDSMSSKTLGHLVDISEDGIMVICDNAIPVDVNYHLRMRLPTQMKERNEIVFGATSRWCKTDANPDFFLAGFRLHELEDADRDLVRTLIRDFSYSEAH